jgi:hypothetical protein
VRDVITKQTAVRGLVAFLFVALGLVAAIAGSSTPTQISFKGKNSQRDFSRFAPGSATKTEAGVATSTGLEIKHGIRVAPAVFNGSVRTLPRVARPAARVFRAPELEAPETELPGGQKQPLPGAEQPRAAVAAPSAPAPAPTISFKGLDKAAWGAGFPPDTVGDVGPTHFVQAVNTSVGIFRKSDGVRLAAFTFDDLWAATGTACDSDNAGDPTVVYDPLGDRWIVADFAFAGDGSSAPYYECIAVSKTPDPSGEWYLYPIRVDDPSHPYLADYPKMGIWPDGLYMTANEFCFAPTPGCLSSGTYKGVRVWAFNRADLESGVAVRNVVVDLGSTDYFSLMPSNMRTVVGAPPAGRENILVSESGTDFAFEVWKFHVDYSGSGSTFTGPANVSQASYNFIDSDVPTPGNPLDSLFDRMMMQAQYTNIGGAESVWVNHTVRCCGHGSPMGIQWAQINVTGGLVATPPVQQQIYPSVNDGLHRWMASLAVDKKGDMALGYSVANAITNPDIRYAGRLTSDPPNTLPQTETTMLSGVTRGSQTGNCGGSTCTRWGDYSAMTIDPDGCRFWYTQEYYETTGSSWQTRIGSFSFPFCSTKANQTITFAAPADKLFSDGDFGLAATASSGLAVSFAASGNCTVSGSTLHLTGAGSCTVTASQPGDSNYNAAPDVARIFSIAKGNQAITFGALAGKTFGDADFAVGATASSGLAVSFAASGNCTNAAATVHLTGAGSCTVTASQGGDSNYNAASDVSQTFAVAKASQTISFAALAAKTFGAADFALSATSSSGLAVTFAASGSCSVSGATVHITAGGSCTVTASQAGDSNHAAAAGVAQTFAIAKASQAITFRALANKRYPAANFSVSARASSGLPVSFAASGRCTVSGATVHLTGTGSCTITAAQAGNANYNAAASVSRTFSIKRVTCTVPRVVDKRLAAARSAIAQRHCRTGVVRRAYSSRKRGVVTSQSRRPGNVVPANSKIDLVVSRGRRP